MNLFDLTGKVAVVTGSSKGIGRAIVERMADHGARVVVSSRTQVDIDAVADSINEVHPHAAIGVRADISNRAERAGLIEGAMSAFGRIDVLVCNAAYSAPVSTMAEISDDEFCRLLEVNVVANHALIQAVTGQMVERRDGSIIIISSIGGLRGGLGVAGAYNVSKAADFQMARSLAVELGPSNVRVNCIAPGLVRTDLARDLWQDPDRLAAILARTPLCRLTEPDDVAGVAVMLAAAAGRSITGETIVVDGGKTMA